MDQITGVRRRLEFVVKISKFCNLRCRYCYELHDLDKRERMSLEDIRRLSLAAAEHAGLHGHELVHFIWHGGEPLLIKPAYYRQIADIQRSVFAGVCAVRNTIQTNLTLLPEGFLDLVEEGFFEGVGVSFDPYGSDRVDVRGRRRDEAVIGNLQTLIDRGVPCGAITVLSRGTREAAAATFRVFDALRIPHRFLPYYMSADGEQLASQALTFDEIRQAYFEIVDAWFESNNATAVDPIEEYLRYATDYLRGDRNPVFVPNTDEFVFIVDVDGGLWGVNGAYDPEEKYGDIFADTLAQVLGSANRARLVEQVEARMARTCHVCPYFGSCPGKYVAHATAEERRLLDQHGCLVRETVSHILARLRETGLDRDVAAGPSADNQSAGPVSAGLELARF